eukprot:CAMPEP_0172031672 /NCGR_PEP_ID=MMETSP1041-20130122/19439_1 /TAXON_ID=464988 /ORGANISM="Hemiselmis andersenii, Strain CCMP439" /LENGTH=427 /DNA_ID=CAMNT_0012688217 /DNA_START=54 /DNA_END=1337 /DNA_ORIENTATION=-
MDLRLPALGISFVASAAGCIFAIAWPWYGRSLLFVKIFSGGVISSLSLVHIICEAAHEVDELMDYPLAGVCALAGLLGTVIVEHSMMAASVSPCIGHNHQHGTSSSNSSATMRPTVRRAGEARDGLRDLLLAPMSEEHDTDQSMSEAVGESRAEAVWDVGVQEGTEGWRFHAGNTALAQDSPQAMATEARCGDELSAAGRDGYPRENPVVGNCQGGTTPESVPQLPRHVCVHHMKTISVAADSKITDLDSEGARELEDGRSVDQHVGIRYRLVAIMFEISCLLHSVFIGAAIGLALDKTTQAVLMIAVSAHQVLEGISLGCALRSAGFSAVKNATMIFSFAAAIPIGILIGMYIQVQGGTESKEMKLLAAATQSLSGGMLLYNGVVQVVLQELSREQLQRAPWHVRRHAYAALVLGASSMCVVAIWL